jgi:hypothetical protein
VTLKGGDAITFDARWWHGTSYTNPFLMMFFIQDFIWKMLSKSIK